MAALLKFGLLQVHGGTGKERQVKLTSLGIELSAGSSERDQLLKKAALNPDIYSELWEKYQGELPDDTVIKPYLLIQKHFNKSAVDLFVRCFRETIAFAKLDSGDTVSNRLPEQKDEQGKPAEVTPARPAQNTQQVKTGDSVIRELPIPMEGGLTARIPYPLSEDDYQILVDTLTLWKKRIVRQPESFLAKVLKAEHQS